MSEKDSTHRSFEIEPGTIIIIFGGRPFEEECLIYWNFVYSEKGVIEKAKNDRKEQNPEVFLKVPGDEEEYLPLPKSRTI